MLMMRKETGGAGMEESWAAGLGWEKLIPVTPQHLDIYTVDISTHLHRVYLHIYRSPVFYVPWGYQWTNEPA